MRVLIMSPSFSGLFLGSTKGQVRGMGAFYRFVTGLRDAGHEVHLLLYAEERSVGYEVVDGIHVHRYTLPFADFWGRLRQTQSPLHRFSWLGYTLLGYFHGCRLVERLRPAIIYTTEALGLAAYLVSRRYGLPSIRRLYGTFLFPVLGDRFFWLRHPVMTLGFKLPCDCLLVTNDGTQGDKVAQHLGVPKERLKFWMDGVDKDIYDPTLDPVAFKQALGLRPEQKVVLAVNRLAPWKCTDRVIQAAPEVITAEPNTVFLIVGEGPERPRLESMIKTLGVEGYVRLIGSVPMHQVKAYMNAADIFLSLYDLSNVGNSLLEAVSCGKCVVALDVGGTAKVVKHGETGILVSPLQISSLPGVIVDLLQDDRRRLALGTAARQWIADHVLTWDERIGAEVGLVESSARGSKKREQVLACQDKEHGFAK